MAKLLKVVGGFWAIMGAADILYMFFALGSSSPTSSETTGAVGAIGLIFNFVLFIIPGLIVYGIGVAISKRATAPQSTRSDERNLSGRKCPFCAEEIQWAAIKCKHCGSDVTATERAESNEPKSLSSKQPEPRLAIFKNKFRVQVCILLVLIALLILLDHFLIPAPQ
jgi:hypothetical protein